MDPGTKDRLIRNITIAVTGVSAAILLSADYGPRPHALSPFSNAFRDLKHWFWTPSLGEQAELQRRLAQTPSPADPIPSPDAKDHHQ